MRACRRDHERSARDGHRVITVVVEHEIHDPSMNHEPPPHADGNAMRPQKACGNGVTVEHGGGAHELGIVWKFEHGGRHDSILDEVARTKRSAAMAAFVEGRSVHCLFRDGRGAPGGGCGSW